MPDSDPATAVQHLGSGYTVEGFTVPTEVDYYQALLMRKVEECRVYGDLQTWAPGRVAGPDCRGSLRRLPLPGARAALDAGFLVILSIGRGRLAPGLTLQNPRLKITALTVRPCSVQARPWAPSIGTFVVADSRTCRRLPSWKPARFRPRSSSWRRRSQQFPMGHRSGCESSISPGRLEKTASTLPGVLLACHLL
jgi:hypothetical protein